MHARTHTLSRSCSLTHIPLLAQGLRRQFKGKVFDAWHCMAALAAEHKRVVGRARARRARKTQSEALFALLAHALRKRKMHKRWRGAVKHVARAMQRRALGAWWERTLHWRNVRAKWQMAMGRRPHMLLDHAFYGWLHQREMMEVRVCVRAQACVCMCARACACGPAVHTLCGPGPWPSRAAPPPCANTRAFAWALRFCYG